MSIACIETPRARVALESERLRVSLRSDPNAPVELLGDIPLVGLESVVINSLVNITTPALIELMRRRIPVHVVEGGGRPLGICLPMATPQSSLRMTQYAKARDADFNLEFSKSLLDAKIFNQRRVLQRLKTARSERLGGPNMQTELPRGDEDLENALQKLGGLRLQLNGATCLPSSRGIEGAAASLYFKMWSTFLPPEFPFEFRSARPPHNAVNACIGYASAILYQHLTGLIHQRGLDPGPGHLHETMDNRWSLALDLMEPFRPVMLEGLTTRLLTLRQLSTTHFEPKNGGVYLTTDGRRTLIDQFYRRLDREFMSDHCGHRTTLRQQLTETVISYRRTLETSEPFRPFRLN